MHLESPDAYILQREIALAAFRPDGLVFISVGQGGVKPEGNAGEDGEAPADHNGQDRGFLALQTPLVLHWPLDGKHSIEHQGCKTKV